MSGIESSSYSAFPPNPSISFSWKTQNISFYFFFIIKYLCTVFLFCKLLLFVIKHKNKQTSPSSFVVPSLFFVRLYLHFSCSSKTSVVQTTKKVQEFVALVFLVPFPCLPVPIVLNYLLFISLTKNKIKNFRLVDYYLVLVG